MDELNETAQDARDAFEDLRTAVGAEPQQRRALKAVLNELYRLQEYRLGPDKANRNVTGGLYFTHAESCDPGRTTLGIMYLRGVLSHHLTKPVQPARQPLHSSQNGCPSQDFSPGPRLAWISGAELQSLHTPEPQFAYSEPYYLSHVGGRLVLPTIREALDFLLTDPVVVTLV